jgi:hypothetical protein
MRVWIASALMVCAVPWVGMCAAPSYSLGVPTAPIMRVTADAAGNEWLASNSVYSVASCMRVAADGEKASSKKDVVDLAQVVLAGCEAGFSMERVKPEVYLGEALVAPADVDWGATYEAYQASADEQAAFIFDAKNQKVYVQAGGTHEFTWKLTNGEEQTKDYVMAGVSSGRPYRMFWTDSPYNAPAVNLSGRFIKLFGPDSIVKPVYGTTVTDQGGVQVTNNNVIVSGVFLDEASSCLYARGKVTGQFIVAFYDSGSFDTLQRVQVVEVGQPDVNYMTGYIGEKIEPYGTGYGTSGLTPSPVTVASTSSSSDMSGAYYYQHQGAYSYSPKHGWIFPLRPTVGEAWRLDVYWMETDAHGVSWPFERCNYSCTWNTNKMTTLVAGAPVKLPSNYEVTLCGYQEPEGHARAPESNIFKTQGEGFSMLKVVSSDNVWFIPVRSIARTNENFFTLKEANWLVGSELRPRSGSVRGTADGYVPVVDAAVSGLLNLDESGNNYNANLYYDRTATSNELESVIYGVNATGSGKPLEVFWSTSVQQEGMDEKIAFPSLVQRYNITWPKTTQVPQIVLASQLGGAGRSRYATGSCAYFDDATANVTLPNVNVFHTSGGAISFWAKGSGLEGDGHLLTLGAAESSPFRVDVDVKLGADGVSYVMALGDGKIETPYISTSAWHKVVFSLSSTSGLTAYVDGQAVASAAVKRESYSGYLEGNSLGGGSAAAKGILIDDFAVWSHTFDEEEASNQVYQVLTDLTSDDLKALAFGYVFEDSDLDPTFGTGARAATELKSKRTYAAVKVLRASPGAPVVGDGVFESDTTPVVYRQPTKGETGYNPNEEHAFVASGAGGYYAWALRCDLNEEATSEPFVLVQYEKDGRARMKCFSVLLTNELYTALAANVEAGHILPGPHPIDLLDDPWCPSVRWDAVAGQNYSSAYRDRKNQVWARAAGTIPIRMYYRNQDGFDYPQLTATPAVGAEIPWLSELGKEPNAALLTDSPALWTWNVTWPSGVPTMRIGQTLTTAANNLPEVWSAKSVSVLWPQGDDGARVKLWDPTVARRTGLAGYDTAAALLEKFGFSVDAGNVSLRAGKYTFQDLPPSIGSRFYVDNTQPVTNCVTYIGELESKATGDILWPNVANAEEIEALKNLLPSTATTALKNEWAALIDALGLKQPILPTTVAGAQEAKSTYIPRDHYALTAMGDTGYVTIIENDAPVGSGVGQLGVSEGDAISMHVFAVTNKYYTGRVVAREDPVNLLSQQLTILYTESFAGTADDYEFEWKKAKPTASGKMPKDYTNAYARVYSAASDMIGRTRFTLGTQGDTLANLVNTYYVMRYRAVKGAAKKVMGDTWSDWCGPTLAEGWIQRVVNNVTPYTQRMTDLYENAAETTATMLQAAGSPYTGDVALNQDNLTSVGLIQLYQTLLNKAESMSIAMGSGTGVNDADVNKQLLLATERLADMYTVLGNDAYSDALNPTIGFGTSSDTASAITSYGAATSELFCFDNQVSTLLDEELALLRGRTGENNPSVETYPYYNRLVWNFTRGITAGEVAYAVNYNINSSDKDADIDAEDAAKQYPQGHGDAWGHYLSALSSYYRLLRNPYFTWPVSQMQMLVSDSVVDVDYYDEERFAEIANKLVTTADEVTTRTALKAWRDNGGSNSAGYLDEDTERNFGYGEWGTRGAIAGVANWMVANAILPEAESSDVYYRLFFDGSTCLSCTNIPLSADTAAETGWTLEFQVSAPTNSQHIGKGGILTLMGNTEEDGLSIGIPETITADTVGLTGLLLISSTGDDKGSVSAYNFLSYITPVTNMVEVTYTNAEGQVSTEEAESVVYERCFTNLQPSVSATFNFPAGSLLALHRDTTGAMDLRVLDANGNVLESGISLGDKLRFAAPAHALFGGTGFKGFITEIRGWTGSRSIDALQASRDYVNPRESSLLFYVRGISSRTTDLTLEDITPGSDTDWTLTRPSWIAAKDTGLDIKFVDSGLVRIDRTTVTELTKIPTSVEHIQRTLDRLDAGLNPLGFSDNAIPFDISSAGVAEGTSTHFEQIASRAETALLNAGKLLDRAQTASSYLRRLQNTAEEEEAEAQQSEADYDSQLIAIYGTPFSGDIGPGKMYEQGYTGPDYYHYMYMDLSGYGLTDLNDLKGKYVVFYSPTEEKWAYDTLEEYAKKGEHTVSNALVYTVSANGIIVADTTTLGKRTTYGEIQNAYSDYLLAYVDASDALAYYNKCIEAMKQTYEEVSAVRSRAKSTFAANQVLRAAQGINNTLAAGENNIIRTMELISKAAETGYQTTVKSIPSIMGAGMTVIVSPQTAVDATVGTAYELLDNTTGAGILSIQAIKEAGDWTVATLQLAANTASDYASWQSTKYSTWSTLYSAVSQVNSAGASLITAFAKLNSIAATFDSIIAKGERLQQERELVRSQRVNRLTKTRYNDMLFRNFRDAALSRYSTAYETAQRQVFLAAQVYDYETGLLKADQTSGDTFKAEIIGARALGNVDLTTGKPELGSGNGDAGLADILARLESNYSVLKGRLGINNAQANNTSFSLRRDLFEIDTTAAGDADWKKELSKYLVDDLLSNSEFARYCQSFASTAGLNTQEPALVIPFSSTIDFGKNFFGKTLKAGSAALPSSYYATKIRSAAVKFENYNKHLTTSAADALASTPSVYLVPVGTDRMRAPGDATDTVLDFSVVDQVIPVPYAIGSTELDKVDFSTLSSGYVGTGEVASRIRRFPAFRAQTGDAASDATRTTTRLIGRSAWNTRWLLIIPAGDMLGGSAEDRQKALDIFINGLDSNNDGTLDVSPVTDIILTLDTYSNSGN